MSIVSVLCRPSDRSLNRSLNRNADGTAGGIERRYVTLRSIGMSLFTKKEEPAQENVKSKAAQPTSGKGRPTPKRKDAQAQNLRPLVPKDRDAGQVKAAQGPHPRTWRTPNTMPCKVATSTTCRSRNVCRGASTSVTTSMPASIWASALHPGRVHNPDRIHGRHLQVACIGVAAHADHVCLLVRRDYRRGGHVDKLKKKLIEKFGEQSVAKGMRSGSYAWSRAIQIRRWRLPKPRYPKRGHWPE